MAGDAVELVGVAEVAALLGVTRQHVLRLSRREDFPVPIAVLSAGKIWRRRDVEEWSRSHPRQARPAREALARLRSLLLRDQLQERPRGNAGAATAVGQPGWWNCAQCPPAINLRHRRLHPPHTNQLNKRHIEEPGRELELV